MRRGEVEHVDQRLDWPVPHGGAVVLSAHDEAFAWRDGTDQDMRFEVASVTKLLSSLAVLAAVADGHLHLDDPAGEVDGLGPPAHEGATVRHLLAHASGLPYEAGQGRPRPPGERRIYSNLGFLVLAALTARAVGRAFDDWLDERVLRPLAMTATTLDGRGGYGAGAAAAGVSTLADLALLAGCLLDRGEPVVPAELFADAASVQYPGLAGLVPGVGRYDPCDWGLGLELKDGKTGHWMGERRSPASFGHFGASGCFLWVDPDAGVAAAAVTDRPFSDGGWGLATWPAWSDAVDAPGEQAG
jgi:CubicO group peptidase (beta-lactamase class C family)